MTAPLGRAASWRAPALGPLLEVNAVVPDGACGALTVMATGAAGGRDQGPCRARLRIGWGGKLRESLQVGSPRARLVGYAPTKVGHAARGIRIAACKGAAQAIDGFGREIARGSAGVFSASPSAGAGAR